MSLARGHLRAFDLTSNQIQRPAHYQEAEFLAGTVTTLPADSAQLPRIDYLAAYRRHRISYLFLAVCTLRPRRPAPYDRAKALIAGSPKIV